MIELGNLIGDIEPLGAFLWGPVIASGIGALGGILGGKAQANAMNQPTRQDSTSSITPPEQLGGWGRLSNATNWLTESHHPKNTPDLGPGGQTLNLFNRMYGNAMGANPAGGGGGGYNRGSVQAGAGGGGGGGTPGWQGFLQRIQGMSADPTDYERQVLSGKYLDLENNPHVQAMMDAIRRENTEQTGQAIGNTLGSFAGGGAMGMSGLAMDSRRRVLDDSNENLVNELARANYDLYGQERGRQNEVDAILSGRTSNLWGNAASAYGSDKALQGTLGSARIAANASMKNHARSMGLANRQFNWSMLQDALNASGGVDAANWQNRLQPQKQSLNLTGALSQLMSQFGTTNTHSEGVGPQVSPTGAGVQGAFGGGLAGLGIYNMFNQQGSRNQAAYPGYTGGSQWD